MAKVLVPFFRGLCYQKTPFLSFQIGTIKKLLKEENTAAGLKHTQLAPALLLLVATVCQWRPLHPPSLAYPV